MINSIITVTAGGCAQEKYLGVQLSHRGEKKVKSWAMYRHPEQYWLICSKRRGEVLNTIARELLNKIKQGYKISFSHLELQKIVKKEMDRVKKLRAMKHEPTLQTLTFNIHHRRALRVVNELENCRSSIYTTKNYFVRHEASEAILDDLVSEGFVEKLVRSYKFTKKGLEAALVIGLINPTRYEKLLRKRRK